MRSGSRIRGWTGSSPYPPAKNPFAKVPTAAPTARGFNWNKVAIHKIGTPETTKKYKIKASVISDGKEILTGESDEFSLNPENSVISKDIEISVTQASGKTGNIALEIGIEDGSGITKCRIDIDDTQNAATPYVNSNKITFTKNGLASGVHTVVFKFTDNASKVLYSFTETINVFDNLTTNTWVQNGNEPWFTTTGTGSSKVTTCRITKEMVENASFEVIRASGHENLNARTIAEYLKCSTQPVLYSFKTVDEIREVAYKLADDYHTAFIMPKETDKNPMLALGLNYVRFGYEEKNLFRFLFQTDKFGGMEVEALMGDSDLSGIMEVMAKGMDCDIGEAREIFLTFFCVAHGLASLLANNSMEYDAHEIEKMLINVFEGMIASRKGR